MKSMQRGSQPAQLWLRKRIADLQPDSVLPVRSFPSADLRHPGRLAERRLDRGAVLHRRRAREVDRPQHQHFIPSESDEEDRVSACILLGLVCFYDVSGNPAVFRYKFTTPSAKASATAITTYRQNNRSSPLR